MIKKDITFENLDGVEVTETWYFAFSKLEAVEKELELGGLEETLQRITETSDAQTAYRIFKEIVVEAVGQKSENGNRFIKTPEIRADFEASPAMSELIFSFFEDTNQATAFFEGILPRKDVEAGKAAMAARQAQVSQDAPVAPVLQTAPPVIVDEPKTDQELLAADMNSLNNDELRRLLALKQS